MRYFTIALGGLGFLLSGSSAHAVDMSKRWICIKSCDVGSCEDKVKTLGRGIDMLLLRPTSDPSLIQIEPLFIPYADTKERLRHQKKFYSQFSDVLDGRKRITGKAPDISFKDIDSLEEGAPLARFVPSFTMSSETFFSGDAAIPEQTLQNKDIRAYPRADGPGKAKLSVRCFDREAKNWPYYSCGQDTDHAADMIEVKLHGLHYGKGNGDAVNNVETATLYCMMAAEDKGHQTPQGVAQPGGSQISGRRVKPGHTSEVFKQGPGAADPNAGFAR